MQAEYFALSKATKYFFWLKTALKDLRFLEIPIAIFCDNHSTIDLAENHWISELGKHLDIHHHRILELVYNRTIPLMYIQTKEYLVDMCIKGLPKVQLSKLCAISLGYNEEQY
jgi:hypothetical protein